MMFAPPLRTQCGYQYFNAKFQSIWVTSVVQTDEAALNYFRALEARGLGVRYIGKREAGQDAWVMLPVEYVNGEVVNV